MSRSNLPSPSLNYPPLSLYQQLSIAHSWPPNQRFNALIEFFDSEIAAILSDSRDEISVPPIIPHRLLRTILDRRLSDGEAGRRLDALSAAVFDFEVSMLGGVVMVSGNHFVDHDLLPKLLRRINASVCWIACSDSSSVKFRVGSFWKDQRNFYDLDDFFFAFISYLLTLHNFFPAFLSTEQPGVCSRGDNVRPTRRLSIFVPDSPQDEHEAVTLSLFSLASYYDHRLSPRDLLV